jgi:hypothetical protein
MCIAVGEIQSRKKCANNSGSTELNRTLEQCKKQFPFLGHLKNAILILFKAENDGRAESEKFFLSVRSLLSSLYLLFP